jgi:sulfide:quinone oxidoreductase
VALFPASPAENKLVTASGDVITYEHLVVAVGLQLRSAVLPLSSPVAMPYHHVARYERIKGLPEAFDTPGVGSNYRSVFFRSSSLIRPLPSVKYVEKTRTAIKEFKGGNAIFTFPNSPIKCAGAPQKIMYIAEEVFRKSGTPANIHYHTALPILFGVKKYADSLWQVVNSRSPSSYHLLCHP